MRMTTIALALAVLPTAAAQPEDLPRMTKLAEGVFAYEHIDPTKRGVTVNNLVVVTNDGVLVADGQGTVENTKELVAAIGSLTRQPIRYVVVGSIHGDHRGGDAGFPEGVTFIKEKRDWTLGGHRIQVVALGRAHTGSDLEVYIPEEKILYMSEVFSTRIFPSMANAYPTEWNRAMLAAEEVTARVYVPAHGAIGEPRNWTGAEVKLYRQAIERVIAEGRRLHDANVPVDDAAARADFGEFGSWWRRQENAAGAMKRVYMEIDGAIH